MVLSVKQITVNDPEYQEVLKLRDKILRVPLGLSLWHEDLSGDVHDIILAALQDETVVGCVMLTPKETSLKLRQMAVDDSQQRSGFGKLLVAEAEKAAVRAGFKKIILHARFVAIGFYEKLGYRKKGNMFLEVSIPHLFMEKELS